MNDSDNLIFCPHCGGGVYIELLGCGIFTHACFKVDFTQVDPHITFEEVQKLKEGNLIFGCGYQFRIVKTPEGLTPRICENQ